MELETTNTEDNDAYLPGAIEETKPDDNVPGMAVNRVKQLDGMDAPFHRISSTDDIEPPSGDVQTLYSRTASKLYPGAKQELLKQKRLSTGELIDAVLVFVMPPDKTQVADLFAVAREPEHKNDEAEEKAAKRRWYYEESLTMQRVKNTLAQHREKLNAPNLDADQAARLEEEIAHLEEKVECSQLTLEREASDNDKTFFLKIHAPFETLCAQAEHINLVLPLAEDVTEQEPNIFCNLLHKATDCLKVCAFGDPEPEEDFYSGVFSWENREKFRNFPSDDLKGEELARAQEAFFTPSQRSMLVFHTLEEKRYNPKKENNVYSIGISKLLQKRVYTAAFPLHDGDYQNNDKAYYPDPSQEPGERAHLWRVWAKWGNWYRVQPLDPIRRYFGEKIGFYFTWLGFYTSWLVWPAIIGTIIFAIGLATFSDQVDAEEFCDSNLTMCGLCATCDKWNLTDTCFAYKFGYVFDNGGTVAFALFMSLWATLFLEFWKRKTAATAYDWDVMDFHENEPQRPQFRGRGPLQPHPVTGIYQKHYPSHFRLAKMFTSFLFVVLMLSLVLWAVVGIIIFRAVVRVILYENPSTQESSSGITSALAAVLQLILIMILNKIYGKCAFILTDWENHERQSQYERHLTLKIFLFQFVNSFSSIFYIAFFKGRFTGRPGDYNKMFGVRQDGCAEYGCLLELTIQLSVIMVGKQAINNFQELILPVIMDKLKSRSALKSANKDEEERKSFSSPWEDEYNLADFPATGLFSEYLEMVMQFGFVTLFVASFPLAPLFALANNIFEIRVDATKMLRNIRRPFPLRAEDIGVWFGILNVISICAVITNAFVIAVPSSFIPKLVYEEEYGSLRGYINTSYPESPATLEEGARENEVDCHYRAFRDSDGNYTVLHWQILAARLAFVIVFEHTVYFIKFLFAYIVEDVPSEIRLAIAREEYRQKNMLDAEYVDDEERKDV
eukprot:m.131337 g.131337  ORF g.131337 m.131337 type:complete len:955 (-) comp23726_c0_seq2:101-2965(-)